MAPDTNPRKAKRKAKKNAELEERCAELEAQLLRAQADFQNLRRRNLTDLEAALKRQMQPLLEELLLVLDFLDMALATPVTTDEAKNLAVGVEMTRNRFVQALEAAELRPVRTDGTFDPRLHEAVEAIEDPEREPGTVLETLRRGYQWHDHVLRPARVKVVAGDAPALTEEEDAEATPAEARESAEPDDSTDADGEGAAGEDGTEAR